MSTVNAGWRGPNIVKDGLVLYLDAASGTSYSPLNSGTTWRDISGNSRNASLINGAFYSGSNQGSIYLDGTNDYVNINSFAIPNNNGELSVNMWFNMLNDPASIATLFGDGAQSNTVGYLWCYDQGSSPGLTYQYARDTTRANINVNNYMVGSYGSWVNLCTVVGYNSSTFEIYKNGQIFVSGNLSPVASFPDTNRQKQIGSYGQFSNLSNMLIGPFMMYSKLLTSSEILQNYNATKGRFGL